jgi:hypothetical protein
MKKSLIVFAALALTGSLAFGQDAALKLGAYLDTGVKVTNTSAGNVAYIGGDDSGIPLGSLEVTGAYAQKTTGLNFKFRFEPMETVKVNLENAYYWAVPVDGVKLLFGNIDGSNFALVDDNGANPAGGNGVQAQLSLVPGLAAGAQLSINAANAVSYQAGAGYTVDKIVQAVFNLGTNTANAVDNYGVSASVLAVPGLTLKGAYYATGVATTVANIADGTLGYAITPALSATVIVYDYLTASKIKVNPSVGYTVTPALGVGAGYTYWTAVGAGDINLNATYTFDANAKVIVNADINDTANGNTASNVLKADFRYSF